jgi:hypothetical protein
VAGRIRTIKPELLEDEKVANLSDSAWRLFVASWLLADDYGNARAGSRFLAANVWQDTAKAELANSSLVELAKVDRLRVYSVEGERYLTIPTWRRHQRINNAGKPRVPSPPTNIQELSRRFAESRGDFSRLADTLEVPASLAALPPTSDLRSPTTDPDTCEVETSPALEVFDHWRNVMASPKSKLDAKRRKAIEARLKDFSVADLKRAIDGCRADDFSMGENDRSTKYNGIDVICRDAAHVEKFMGEEPASESALPNLPAPPPRYTVAPGALQAPLQVSLASLVAGAGKGGSAS